MSEQPKNKFQPGNFIYHVPTGSNWIVLSFKKCESNGASAYMASAYCVSTGLKGLQRKYWQVGDIDVFPLTNRDVHPQDKIWIVKNQV